MNRTITTSTTRRQCLRQSLCQCLHQSLRQYLRPAALALITLLALVAASCTADPLDNPDPAAGNGNPDGIITFAIAPRPGFTEVPVSGDGTASADAAPATRSIPATRAEQTDNATRWEQGDILWLDVRLNQDKQNTVTPDIRYTSALKYDVDKWRYLTEAEVKELNAGNISGFSRLVRWPRESADWVDPIMFITAYYAGSGKPGADGTITMTPKGEIPTIPFIAGRGMCSPDGKPVSLDFKYEIISRVRIPAGCKVELTNTTYISTIAFFLDKVTAVTFMPITEIPEQSEDTDVFLVLDTDATAKLTCDGVSPCTFTFPSLTDANGNLIYGGASYTLTPYTSGTQSPVADYDLTIATEDDLRALARAVNAGEKLPNGKLATEARVLQTENIELTKGEWVPIGTGRDNPFRGAYNGNGHEITGLNITTAPQPDAYNDSYAGLFGRAEGAVLTGIRLREVRINITEGGDTDLYVGSIAGYIENSTLSLCTTNGTVNAVGGNAGVAAEVVAGGIAGNSWMSTISRCLADVETKAVVTKSNAAATVGGIVGGNGEYSFILSCESGDRAVTAEGSSMAFAGGIAGFSSSNTFIAFCRTGKNNVTAQNGNDRNYAGGLVGENNGNLVSCYSRATAQATGTGRNRAGAIAGYSPGGEGYCYGVGATGRGTSDLAANPNRNIFYDTDPKDGDIFRVMTGFTGKVESLTDRATTCYPFTTSYAPSATPAYGIIPQRAVWTKDAWKAGGSDPKYPEIDMDYEGGNNE